MAAAVCCPVVSDSLQPQQGSASHQLRHEPINFLYGHLHNSIRTDLDNLSTWALSLEADNDEDLVHRLLHLKERYHFLEQVYKYHSSVEDEVMQQQTLPNQLTLVPCLILVRTAAGCVSSA